VNNDIEMIVEVSRENSIGRSKNMEYENPRTFA
jgi:hypothetical protein